MPIKNRDGTVYKLRGPNPMMENQKTWNEFQIHNMKFRGETAPSDGTVEPISSDFNLRDDFTQALVESKPEPKPEVKVTEQQPVEPVKEVPRIEAPKPKVAEEPKVVASPKAEPVQPSGGLKLPAGVKPTFCYCLPAVMRDRRDGVYGTKYQTIQYKEPFSFEMVIVEEDDLFIQVWSNKEVGTGSILYPRKVDKDGRADSARWWRVQERESRSGGWLLTAYPSDFHPSFENVN